MISFKSSYIFTLSHDKSCLILQILCWYFLMNSRGTSNRSQMRTPAPRVDAPWPDSEPLTLFWSHWMGEMPRFLERRFFSFGISWSFSSPSNIPKRNKSNTECGIIRPTNAIYMGSNSLLGSKALSKCEVNPTSGFQDIAFTSNKLLWRHLRFQDIVFTSNILHRVQC